MIDERFIDIIWFLDFKSSNLDDDTIDSYNAIFCIVIIMASWLIYIS